jgi:hypothetical protein
MEAEVCPAGGLELKRDPIPEAGRKPFLNIGFFSLNRKLKCFNYQTRDGWDI